MHCDKNKFSANENPLYDYLQLPHEAQTASVCYKSMHGATSDTCDNLKTIWQKNLGTNICDNDWLGVKT